MDEIKVPDTGDHRFTRRRLLTAGGAAAVGALAIASGLEACTNNSTQTTAAASGAGTGKKRSIVWAIAAIGDWNLPVDVGFNDASRLIGWNYTKVGLPLAQYSAENQVNVLERAILTKPDVLVTDWWVKGEADPLQKAQQAGIFCMACDADNFPDDRGKLGIAWVGSDFRANGHALGLRLAAEVSKKGKTSGTFLFGVASPGNANVEDRGKGINDAVQEWNQAHGTSFTYERFPDQAGGDASVSSGLYSAKLTQLGSKLVAASGDATSWPTIIIGTLKAKGYSAGQVTLGSFRADPPAINGLKDGWIVASADESFYPFGYVTTMLAWQYFERGMQPSDYKTGGGLIDSTNLAAIQAREAKIQDLAKQYNVKLA
jgi:ABC-type sugar transport system substrate-binding protein